MKPLEPLTFRFSGKIARLLGRESVSNAVVALSELVKNAYDADATRVEIIFDRVKGGNGIIIIRDNGVGMTYVDFKNKWMVVGTKSKERNPKSPSGKRRVVGEKGIGRFAVERLAEKATIVSYPSGSMEGIRMYIDWNKYEKEDALFDEIENPVSSFIKKDMTRQGFEIHLQGLRDKWDEEAVQELEKHLSMLVPPRDITNFEINLAAPEFAKYGLKVQSGLLDEAIYKFQSFLREDGIYWVITKKNERKEGRILMDKVECGPIKFTMYFYPLDDDKIRYKTFKVREISDMIREYGGVKIYRDAFRVKPYGDPGDDWLGLNFRRMQSPKSKIPSNNQVIGFIEISRDANSAIIDTTTREGLIQNNAFHQMKDFLWKSISAFAAHRVHEVRQSKDLEPQYTIDEDIDRLKKIVDSSEVSRPEKKAAEQIITDVKSKVLQLEQEKISTVQVYRNLAALGITVSSVAHEIAAPIAVVMHTSSALIAGLKNNKIKIYELTPNLNIVYANALKVQEFVQFIKGFAAAANKKKTELNLEEVIKQVIAPFRSVLEKRGIEFIANINPNIPHVVMNRADLDSILINLLTNAAYFIRDKKKPIIKISANYDSRSINIRFSDNGLGIPPDNRKIVFQPFFTTKERGSGLGLTIIREIIEDYHGKIEAVENELGEGATFSITLPKSVVKLK